MEEIRWWKKVFDVELKIREQLLPPLLQDDVPCNTPGVQQLQEFIIIIVE